MSFTHNSTVADKEPSWGWADKTALPAAPGAKQGKHTPWQELRAAIDGVADGDRALTLELPREACEFACGRSDSIEFGEGQPDSGGKVPFKMVARTADVVEHPFWGPVVHDFQGMQVHRQSLVVDYCHDQNQVLGYSNRHETDTGSLVQSGFLVPFTPTDRATEVLTKSKAGVPWEASILHGGPLSIEEVDKGAQTEVNGRMVQGPVTIFRQWSLRGSAICPYGADRNTGPRFSADRSETTRILFLAKEAAMADEDVQDDTAQTHDQTAGAGGAAGDQAAETPPAAPAKPAGDQAAAASAKPPDPREEFRQFDAEFGPAGAAYFREGLSLDQARAKHAQTQAKRIVELELRLKQLGGGEAAPLSAQPDTKDIGASAGKSAPMSRLEMAIGTNLARFAMGIRFADGAPIK